VGLANPESVEQGDEIGDQVAMTIGAEPGAVRAAGRQIIGDACEFPPQRRHHRDERLARIGQAVDEDNRRAGAPNEIGHPVAAGVADAATGFAVPQGQGAGQRHGRRRCDVNELVGRAAIGGRRAGVMGDGDRTHA